MESIPDEENKILLKEERRNCPVCLEECKIKSVILPCKHQYHHTCLKLQAKNNV